MASGKRHIVIVGAGFAGASTAFHLSRSNEYQVTLLEREPVLGLHASGRNASLCRQLTGSPAVTALTVRGARFLKNASIDGEPLLQRTGSLLVKPQKQDTNFLAEIKERAHRWQVPVEEVSERDILSLWPEVVGLSRNPSGESGEPVWVGLEGLRVFEDGIINIKGLLRYFIEGSRAHGAELHLDCAVIGLSKNQTSDGKVSVETSDGRVLADAVVNAGGAWVDDIGAQAGLDAQSFTREHRHIHICTPNDVVDKTRPYLWFLGDDEFYLRPDDGGLLVSGCERRASPPVDAKVDDGALTSLKRKLEVRAPSLAKARFTDSRACLRTFSQSREPVIEWDREVPWLFWVAGLGGNGATASHEVGRLAAERISKGLRRLSQPSSQPRKPFSSGLFA